MATKGGAGQKGSSSDSAHGFGGGANRGDRLGGGGRARGYDGAGGSRGNRPGLAGRGAYADIGFGTGNYSAPGFSATRNRPGFVGGPGIGGTNNERYARTSGYGMSSPENPEGITARHGMFGTNASTASTQPSNADLNTAKAFNDSRDLGNSRLDNLGNMIGASFGLNETNPYSRNSSAADYGLGVDPNSNPAATGNANWSLNPAQLAATLAGLATGYPLGGVLRGISYLSGTRFGPEINLGSSVMGAPKAPSTTTGSIVGDNVAAPVSSNTVATDAPNYDYTGSVSTALSRSPFNSKIGGFGAGGWAGGASANRSKAKNPLAQALMAPKF